MQSHDGEGSGKTLALGESIAPSHHLASEYCETLLQIALSYVEFAGERRDMHFRERAIAHARETLSSVQTRLARHEISPAEDARIQDLMAVLEVLLDSDAD